MPGNYLVADEFGRMLRDFTAAAAPTCSPTRRPSSHEDYDPLRLRPIAEDAHCIDKLLGVESDVPIEWRLGEYMAANSTNLLTARVLNAENYGEVFDVLHRNQAVLTNGRTISHRSAANGALAAEHHAGNVHNHLPRFLFNVITSSKLSLFLNGFLGGDRHHQIDPRARCFGSLMQRFDRELDCIDIEFRESEVTFAFSRDVLAARVTNRDERLKRALDQELSRRTGELPVTGSLKDRVRHHIRSNHLSDVSLDEICDSLRVPRRKLGRMLRNEGTTFTDILKDLRRERALHLVRHTNQPLKRVAAQLGFNSDASFSMAFKSWTGTTPMKFRKAATFRTPANDAKPAELVLAAESKSGRMVTRWSQ